MKSQSRFAAVEIKTERGLYYRELHCTNTLLQQLFSLAEAII